MSETQREWVRRVLGVEAAASRLPKLLPIFTTAKDAADAQLDRLATAFRASGHPAAEAIAEQGLPIVTRGGGFAPLIAALIDVDRDPTPAAAGKLRQRLAAFRNDTLAEAGLLASLERNPLGAALSVRAELARSLDQIEAALPQ